MKRVTIIKKTKLTIENIEGLDGSMLVLRSGRITSNGHKELTDRIEIPGRFDPL